MWYPCTNQMIHLYSIIIDPVSLSCIISKVFEKVMYNRLLDFLETYKILTNSQFGFRKSHSTYMALMTLMDRLTTSLENDEHVIGIWSHYGIRCNALKLFEGYLSNRIQYMTYNGISSITKTVKYGVPQGSILGPLLFFIYINDLCSLCKPTFQILFADDANLCSSGKEI